MNVAHEKVDLIFCGVRRSGCSNPNVPGTYTLIRKPGEALERPGGASKALRYGDLAPLGMLPLAAVFPLGLLPPANLSSMGFRSPFNFPQNPHEERPKVRPKAGGWISPLPRADTSKSSWASLLIPLRS